ncbi:MAG: hypothetical protein Q7S50_01010 [bacterium]|nr:hypothetical protein [bacterium]
MDFNAWGVAFSHWPTDWIIIGAFAAFAALDTMRSGTARAAALMLSLPATLFLVGVLPKAALIGPASAQFTAPLAQLAIFAVIFAALYVVAHRAIFTYSDGASVVQALIAGLAATIVLVVVFLQIPALQSLWHVGGSVQMVFGEAYRFWWLVGAYSALAFVRS